MPAAISLAAAERVRAEPGRRGWYEVFYVTTALGGGRAAWLRFTLHAPLDGESTCALWACAFDRARPRWYAGRTVLDGDAWAPVDGGGVRVGDAELTPSSARGEVTDASGRAMSWELRWRPLAPPLTWFPARLERLAGQATFPIAAVPMARASGHVTVDGERHQLDGAPLQQSHLFGGRHANRWAWVHALGFDADPDGFCALVWARPQRLGGRVPAVASLLLGLDGRLHRTGPLGLRWDDLGGDAVGFVARAGEARVEGALRAHLQRFTGVTYHDPDGATVHCANTEVADLVLRVRIGGEPERTLRCDAACGFERGARTPAEGIWRPL